MSKEQTMRWVTLGLRLLDRERAVLIDDDGTILGRTWGGYNLVIPDWDASKCLGNTYVHNHATAMPPSPSDIYVSEELGYRDCVVVTKDRIYTLTFPSVIQRFLRLGPDFKSVWYRAMEVVDAVQLSLGLQVIKQFEAVASGAPIGPHLSTAKSWWSETHKAALLQACEQLNVKVTVTEFK